jgi:hypothetical protein
MFRTENVEAYLKSILLKADGEKRLAILRFFITPVSFELAQEASPAIADRLFRKAEGEAPYPVLEMGRTDFVIQVPTQSMGYRRHPEYVGHEALVNDVEVGKISAQKVIPDDPRFSLIFNATFEIVDKNVIPDLVSLMQEKLYLTFKPMQPGLFPENEKYDGVLCRLCEAPNPEFIVDGSKTLAYCQNCVDQRSEGEAVVRIRNTDQAAAAIQTMQEKDHDDEEPKPEDPLFFGADINAKAAKRQRKRVH